MAVAGISFTTAFSSHEETRITSVLRYSFDVLDLSFMLSLSPSFLTFAMAVVQAIPTPEAIIRSRQFALRSASSPHIQRFLYHAQTAWLFIRNDVKNITTIGVFFAALNAPVASVFSMGPNLSFAQILAAVPAMVLWSWSNLFLFNLHNQRRGVDEDALNKPWRPLPAGRLTVQQATLVLYCMYPITLIIALTCGGLVPCLLEAVFCLWYNEWGGSDDPLLKNILNGLGIPCFLIGPLEVATGHTMFSGQGTSTAWLLIIGGAIAITSHVQDFRDVEGDRASGRITVPIAIGDTNARLLAALSVWGFTEISCWFWQAGWIGGAPAWIAAVALVANLFLSRGDDGDDRAWKKLWFFWMAGLFSMPLLSFPLSRV